MSFKKEEHTLDIRMYTAQEVIKKFKDALSDIVIETSKEEDGGQLAVVEMLVGSKLISRLEEKMKSGEF